MSEQQPPIPPYSPQPQSAPGPHFAQPGTVPPGAYPVTGHPASASSAAPRIALVLAVVALVLGLTSSLAIPFLYRLSYTFNAGINALLPVGNVLVFVIALAALIVGLVAVRDTSRRLMTGIAIGIAGSELIAISVSWMSSLIYTFGY